MTDDDRGHLVAVHIGGCQCPGAPRPHPDGDNVYLDPRPSLRLGLAANAAIGQAVGQIQLQEMLGVVFIRYGVRAWNLTDERGRPSPVTPDAVEERLTWDAGGSQVADAAADLYTDAITAPLANRLSSLQAPGPTVDSTSPTSPWSPATPGSSAPSSQENSGDGT